MSVKGSVTSFTNQMSEFLRLCFQARNATCPNTTASVMKNHHTRGLQRPGINLLVQPVVAQVVKVNVGFRDAAFHPAPMLQCNSQRFGVIGDSAVRAWRPRKHHLSRRNR